MKIGLVDFGSKRIIMDQNIPHLGLAYVAAVLELHGHQIHMLDSNQAGRKVTEEFISNTYDVIGLSATSFTYNQTNEFAAKMRSHNKEAIIVIGGPHVAIGMETVLDSPSFDYAVCGEGEYTMLDLVTILEKSRQPKCDDLYAIKGLIFRDKGKPVATPRRQRINSLDELPFPAFHLLQMEHYGFYPLLTSRGCPFGCSFCSIKAIWGTLWTHRSVDNIIQEIEYARGKLHWEKKPFNLIDDSFNVVPKRVMEFCERLIESGLNILWFSSGFRADRVPYELACKMKESGCIGVSVGIESSNDETLKRRNPEKN
jgi:magnesium-protoporphyrin IX monomethyl ester (oxidative) cyclase